MCWRCFSPFVHSPSGDGNYARITKSPSPAASGGKARGEGRAQRSGDLSRRSFNGGLLAAAIQPPPASCLPGAADAIVDPRMSLAVPTGSARTVALTLDACSGAVDGRILDVLIGLSIPATIFVTGIWLRANGAALGMLRARPDLFTLQNHGELHLPPILGSRRIYGLPVAGTIEAVHREVDQGAAWVTRSGAPAPGWYRGAAALYSPAAIEAIQDMGYRVAGYSLSGDEGASLPAATVANRIASAASGDVIIAHVNQPHRSSGAGVATGVTELFHAGATFVFLDALPMTPLSCRPHGRDRPEQRKPG